MTRSPRWDSIRPTLTGTLLALLAVASGVSAEISDLQFTDVTTRAFSVIWASDEAVVDASVRVFDDAPGSSEIIGVFDISLDSERYPPAFDNGVVRITVAGLAADTCVYVQTQMTTASGDFTFPTTPPFLEVCTAVATHVADDSGAPMANDLLRFEVFEPDGAQPAAGALLIIKAPQAEYGLSAFVGEGFAPAEAVINLNNFFDLGDGQSSLIQSGEILSITEFRSRICSGLQDHIVRRSRVAPVHEEFAELGGAITELEDPGTCASLDPVCDQEVNSLDVQLVLNGLSRLAGCGESDWVGRDASDGRRAEQGEGSPFPVRTGSVSHG